MTRRKIFLSAIVLGGLALAAGLALCVRWSKPAQPLLRVNRHVLTVQEKDSMVALMVEMARAGKPDISDSEIRKLQRQFGASYTNLYIRQSVVADYAAREGVVVSPELMTEFQKRAVANKGRAYRVKTYDDLLTKLGAHAPAFSKLVTSEASFEAFRQHVIATHPTNFPPTFVAEEQERIRLHNIDMAASNVVIFARATNVWNRLVAAGGTNFTELVKQYSQIPEEVYEKGEWGVLDAQQIADDPEVYRYANSLPIGEFSPPIEGDNGLMILRVDARDTGKKEYTLSRIFFLLPNFWPNLSAEQILKNAQNDHARAIVQKTLRAELDAAEIERFDFEKESK